MYLHLGQDVVVRQSTIVGIFDLENSTIEKSTREYLAKAEKLGRVVNVSPELPKSFVVCCQSNRRQKKGEITVYLSQLAAQTLKKRWNQPFAGLELR